MMDFNLFKFTLEKKLYLYYLSFMGLQIIIIYINIRLFLPRTCYTLEDLRLHHTILHLLLYIDFILIHFFIVGSIVYNFYKNYNHLLQKSRWINYFQNIINILYWNPLLYLHDLIAPEIPYSGIFMVNYSNFIENSHRKRKSFIIIDSLAILFVFIPRILLVLLFIIEICLFNRIHYFIHFLPLLLLPQIYKIFLKLCESLCERSIPIIEEDLIIIPKTEQNFSFSLKEEVFLRYGKNIDYTKYCNDLIRDWFVFYRLSLVTNKIKTLIKTYEPYISVFCSLLYLIAGLYKLWFVFF